jgi:rod shape-determining protein MreC
VRLLAPLRVSRFLPLIGLFLLIVFAPIRRACLTVLRWPYRAAAGTLQAVFLVPQLPQLAREQSAWQEQLAQVQLENAQLRAQLRALVHAEALKALPGLPEPRVVAQVVGRSTLPAEHTVLLNRGRRHGVDKDIVVIDIHGVMGRVADADEATALVMLLTDADSRVGAAVERSRETGLLVGRGRSYAELIYLDLDADIEVGDRVVTAGLGELFPKGLVLGTVVDVRREPVIGSTSAWVRPAARLGQVEEVLCLPPAR